MSRLFEKTTINTMELNNRFVRSATWEGMAADDGTCTARLTHLMQQLAEGGVGLIITSHAYIRRDGQAGPWQLGIYQDEQIEPLRNMTASVHERGGKILLQLAHAGYFADPKLTGQAPLAMSNVAGFAKSERREMSRQEIEGLVQDFTAAGRRAQEAGFDGVQIHAAHGYLLSQSLSAAFNRRSDRYGGSLQNRARFLLQVLAALRNALGPEYPVLAKINSEDCVQRGLTHQEALEVGGWLQDGGIDAIEVSGGTVVSGPLKPMRERIHSEDKEAYFRETSRLLKASVRVPIILVGGMRSFGLLERLLDQEVADYFSMARPFIREPHLVKRWQGGDLRKATCVSDNQCFEPARAGEGIHCVVERQKREGAS